MLLYEAEGGNNGFSYSNNSGHVTTYSGRIEAVENSGKKFVQTKRMMLIK